MSDAERLAAYLADLAARPTTRWVHVIEHDHRTRTRVEFVARCTDTGPDEAIASRIKRLRNTPPSKGWSRDGATLHIDHGHREEWVTNLPADAHTEESRSVEELTDTHQQG